MSGVRNPYRTTIRPGSPAPGTLYIGDVGWNWYEEINIARGGENFGWPCRSGGGPAQSYPSSGDPAHSGCDSIETPENLRLRFEPVADCARYDRLRGTGHGAP